MQDRLVAEAIDHVSRGFQKFLDDRLGYPALDRVLGSVEFGLLMTLGDGKRCANALVRLSGTSKGPSLTPEYRAVRRVPRFANPAGVMVINACGQLRGRCWLAGMTWL